MENAFDVKGDRHRDGSALLLKQSSKFFQTLFGSKNASANGHDARRPPEVRTQGQTGCGTGILVATSSFAGGPIPDCTRGGHSNEFAAKGKSRISHRLEGTGSVLKFLSNVNRECSGLRKPRLDQCIFSFRVLLFAVWIP